VTLRLRRERFLVGLHGLALLRGWPFESPDEADAQLGAVRSIFGSPQGDVDVDDLDVDSAYAAWAETYDQPNALISAEEPIVRRFIDGISAGVSLDVACGTGRVTRLLADHGHRAIGVDRSAEMLARARRNVPGASFVLGDVRGLPFEDRTLDLVICALALTHVTRLADSVTEMARVLRPGGYMIVSDVHPIAVVTGAHAFFLRTDGSRGVTRNEVHWASEYVDAFRSAGLAIERAAEPPFEESFVEEMSEGAIRDAARDALVGLPFALVWLVTKEPESVS
jgi:ubiquinone/menaquinone biosynthesis C-methylase UbiE